MAELTPEERELLRLKARIESVKKDFAQMTERAEKAERERDQARKAIESFGNTEFDWSVLEKIDELEAENDRLREALQDGKLTAKERAAKMFEEWAAGIIVRNMPEWFERHLLEHRPRASELQIENARLESQAEKLTEIIERMGLVWSKEPPTEIGVYKWRKYPKWPSETVTVVKVNGELMMDGWQLRFHDGEWAGPIPEPREESE